MKVMSRVAMSAGGGRVTLAQAAVQEAAFARMAKLEQLPRRSFDHLRTHERNRRATER